MTSRQFDHAVAAVPAAPGAAERGAAPGHGVTRASGGRLSRAGQTLIRLQRQRGNHYVQQVVQAKLMLGPPEDHYEREADRIAEQVMRGTAQPAADGAEAGRIMCTPAIQRVHSAQAGVADATVQQAVQGARGGGQPLPSSVRSSMEEALATDFSGVRLHTDDRADQLTRSLRARAFTTGQDIFFRRGQYNSSNSSRHVLAHELTHVVQQGGGSAPSLIQRRIGFEFETTAQVRGGFREPDRNGQSNLGLFTNDKEFYRPTATGRWMIAPDTGRMEFVTDPLSSLQDLRNVTGQIQQFITAVQTVPRERNIRAIRPGKWTAPAGSRPNFTAHVGHGDNFEADVSATDWYGQPQVSVGVLTTRVARFLDQARTTHTLNTLKQQIPQVNPVPPMPTKGIPSHLQNIPELMNWWTPALLDDWMPESVVREADDLVRRYANGLPQVQQDKLRGLWALMRVYWTHLTKPTNEYKKSLLRAMARTDFHSFYKNLNRDAKDAFANAQGTFVLPSALNMIPGTQITLARWYESVMQPVGSTYVSEGGNVRDVDLLSANRSTTNAADVIATGTDKSMGQYPLDPTGGNPRAVFELRRVTPGARIPISLMYDHVLEPIFNFVRAVEQ